MNAPDRMSSMQRHDDLRAAITGLLIAIAVIVTVAALGAAS